MLGVQTSRPPYVTYERSAIEDRNATRLAGHRVVKDINLAKIMQIGSRDQVERVAEEWLEANKKKVMQGIYPEEWQRHFQEKFDRWKEGLETPAIGTPIREWPPISPAQAENLIAAHVTTIEDLAILSEEGMARVGAGARDLRQKAKEWLSAASDIGRVAAQVEALKIENEELRRRLDEFMQAAPPSPLKRRGRPRKDVAA